MDLSEGILNFIKTIHYLIKIHKTLLYNYKSILY
ncbi:hypothetical protein QE357_001614 [Siphonobacter sp. BAB-5404]|nr:hypothetical protein [Siphonobacter sp. SORGH_AS_1065]MDR6194562.1 hypothetical protein [Siphonobacter sp. SORGH_AS_0500]